MEDEKDLQIYCPHCGELHEDSNEFEQSHGSALTCRNEKCGKIFSIFETSAYKVDTASVIPPVTTVDFKKYPFVYNGTALRSLANRAHKGIKFNVINAPLSQAPFLVYFGHEVDWDTIRDDVKYGLWNMFNKGEVKDWIQRAKAGGNLRDLVEMFCAFSPVGADILMQCDYNNLTHDEMPKVTEVSSFHSYNRSYVRELLDEMSHSIAPQHKKCLLLPCSATRPYNESKKHKHIYETIHNLDEYYKVVITTIGVVPEEYWNHPLILSYNNSYPDLWQVYLRCKEYFSLNKFDEYINCHRYEPFVEIIKLCGITEPTKEKIKKRA